MKELEEQIAKIGYETKAARVFRTYPKWEKLTPDGCQQEDWRAVARAILALGDPPIREILQKWEGGKLVELDEDQREILQNVKAGRVVMLTTDEHLRLVLATFIGSRKLASDPSAGESKEAEK